MASHDNLHRCPVGDCPEQIPAQRLMCPAHWRRVPSRLKRALRQAWRHGDGAGSRAHRAAVRACIEAARARRPPSGPQNLRHTVRRVLAAYRHPNPIAGESWDEEDTALRVLRCPAHKPDPRTSRCLYCGAPLPT